MALWKKFDGKYYGFDSQFQHKEVAKRHAEILRESGNRARITYENERYIVWVGLP